MGIYGNMDEDYSAEELEYEFHRLMSIAEAYTGAERLRQRLPPNLSERVVMVQRFIQEEQAMRDLTPYTIEDMKRKVDQSVSKDDFYERI